MFSCPVSELKLAAHVMLLLAIPLQQIAAQKGAARGAEGPVIVLSGSVASFSGIIGVAAPAEQKILVTNGGKGSLNGLATQVNYQNPLHNWLTASLSSTSTPGEITLEASTGNLKPGKYSANVIVAGNKAQAQTIAVNFTVGRDPGTYVGTYTLMAPAPGQVECARFNATDGSPLIALPKISVDSATNDRIVLSLYGYLEADGFRKIDRVSTFSPNWDVATTAFDGHPTMRDFQWGIREARWERGDFRLSGDFINAPDIRLTLEGSFYMYSVFSGTPMTEACVIRARKYLAPRSN